MLFNPDPAKPANEVVFSNREDVNLPNLCFVGNMIRRLNSQKHLGLTLDSKLTFNQHLKEKMGKANNGILMIRKLYRYLPRSTLLIVYKSFIRPHLLCNDDISMQNSSQVNICQPNKLFTDKIESVQYNAALAITECIHGTSKGNFIMNLG